MVNDMSGTVVAPHAVAREEVDLGREPDFVTMDHVSKVYGADTTASRNL